MWLHEQGYPALEIVPDGDEIVVTVWFLGGHHAGRSQREVSAEARRRFLRLAKSRFGTWRGVR